MNYITRNEISSDLAHQMVGRAIEQAAKMNVEVCAVVCDPRGHLAALARTDHVMPPAIQFATDKAWTAANFSISSHGLYERVAPKPPVAMGFANRERVLFFPGGIPIFESNACIGGMGVSGAKDQEDIDIATIVIEEYGLAVKKPSS